MPPSLEKWRRAGLLIMFKDIMIGAELMSQARSIGLAELPTMAQESTMRSSTRRLNRYPNRFQNWLAKYCIHRAVPPKPAGFFRHST